ncbi:ADP-ribose pyrophosphatase [Arenicella chitinivorans]|uniref:GDP-mannose pyrophosphatase n=1 Tax=Arenicella chitinivorans TaxID=1329800 RepID=A0A918RNC2_9GAMM|nr:NUDIX hydrolase [Arenicella chitinivorans]GHA03478.1 ADP-ribose pyrophosphatase [Arenicella chitinivorans]
MRNKLIHKGSLIDLHKERVDFPNGGHTYFDIVKHPGGAVIAAINEKDEVCLLKQWRHAVGRFIWEFPAGCLEPNEPPLETARRELEEEAGVKAHRWRDLGKIVCSPGFSNEVLYLFEARDLADGQVNLDDAEQLDAHWLPLKTVKAMCLNGEIDDAKTLALLLRLESDHPFL